MTASHVADYRERLYDRYVTSREGSLVPQSVTGFKPQAPYLTRMVRKCFPPDRDAAILDIGCGHGTLIYFARLLGYRNITGVDMSAEQVAEARRLGIEGVSQGTAIETLRAQPHASQDAVVTIDVIEHLKKDELLELAAEVLRTLKPGGRWIIHAPNAVSPMFGVIRYGDYTHEQAFTPLSMRQLLLTAGFGRVEFYDDEPVPHGLKSLVRLGLWKLIKLAISGYLLVETGTAGDRIFTVGFLTVTFK